MSDDAFAMVESPDLETVFKRTMRIIQDAAPQLAVGGLALATVYWFIGTLSAGTALLAAPLVATPLSFGMFIVAYKAGRHEPVTWGDLGEGFRMPAAYLLGVLIMVGVTTGLVLFILPGLYLAMALMYAKSFAVSREQGGLDAFVNSIKLFNRNLAFSLLISVLTWAIFSLGNGTWILGALLNPVVVVMEVVVFEMLIQLPKNADLR